MKLNDARCCNDCECLFPVSLIYCPDCGSKSFFLPVKYLQSVNPVFKSPEDIDRDIEKYDTVQEMARESKRGRDGDEDEEMVIA